MRPGDPDERGSGAPGRKITLSRGPRRCVPGKSPPTISYLPPGFFLGLLFFLADAAFHGDGARFLKSPTSPTRRPSPRLPVFSIFRPSVQRCCSRFLNEHLRFVGPRREHFYILFSNAIPRAVDPFVRDMEMRYTKTAKVLSVSQVSKHALLLRLIVNLSYLSNNIMYITINTAKLRLREKSRVFVALYTYTSITVLVYLQILLLLGIINCSILILRLSFFRFIKLLKFKTSFLKYGKDDKTIIKPDFIFRSQRSLFIPIVLRIFENYLFLLNPCASTQILVPIIVLKINMVGSK
jgi:hypothetical protein